MIDVGNGQMSTPLIDVTNAKIQNPSFNCDNLRDPTWALRDQTYNIAPDEPATVDWSQYAASSGSLGSANDYNGAQAEDVLPPRPAPTPNTFNTAANSVYVPAAGNNNNAGNSNSGGGVDGCPLDYTGYYPKPGCATYVNCQSGNVVGVPQPCSGGTLFSLEIYGCTWDYAVTCEP